METFITKENCIKLLIGSKNLLEQKLQIKKLIAIVRKINHQEMLNEGKEIFLMLQMLK